jgi:hypothetical protein
VETRVRREVESGGEQATHRLRGKERVSLAPPVRARYYCDDGCNQAADVMRWSEEKWSDGMVPRWEEEAIVPQVGAGSNAPLATASVTNSRVCEYGEIAKSSESEILRC